MGREPMAELLEMLEPYRGRKIAVYGLGLETENILPQLDGVAEVVGLLASYRDEGTIYGREIIPFSRALEEGVALILVVARPGSCKTIAKKIGPACKERQIDLLDIRGRNLCEERKALYDLTGMVGMTREELRAALNGGDVISFDLFDTLVMRNTLFSTDVHEMTAQALEKRGVKIPDFCGRRQSSERLLSRSGAPTLEEIYAHMLKEHDIQGISAAELARLEWELDLKLLLPRRELCDLARACAAGGKKEIYITSDTYYTKNQLAQLLDRCGICFYADILASCEFGRGKKQGLFEELKRRANGKRCVHVGDNGVADIECAQRSGIPAYKIYSAEEFLEQTGYLGLEKHLGKLSCRIKAGMFAARLFNSPFQFETQERRLGVERACDIGYLLFGPMISDFVLWFYQKIQEEKLKNVWLCARDGYLIKKMYDLLAGDGSCTYFLTSRAAALRAGVSGEDDLYMHFSGPLEKQLWVQFGLRVTPECAQGKELRDFKEAILERAKVCRENYRRYMERLESKQGGTAFFDFVSKGTCQMFMERLTENHLRGIYFFRVRTGVAKYEELEIESFYDAGSGKESVLLDDFFLLEPVLTSPEPSVLEFDGDGKPVYEAESRSAEAIVCAMEVQEGILDYFRNYLSICEGWENSTDGELDEAFLALIHRLEIKNEAFLGLKNENVIMNRSAAVADLL